MAGRVLFSSEGETPLQVGVTPRTVSELQQVNREVFREGSNPKNIGNEF